MSKLIEIVGPSGIGKSYIYNKVRDAWNENDSWAVYHDYRYKRKGNNSLRFNEKLLQLYIKIMEGCKYYSYIKSGSDKMYNLKKVHEENEYFIETSLDIINEYCKSFYNGKDNRYQSTIYLLKSLEEVQAIKEIHYDRRKCVFDEGLINRIMHLNAPEFSDNTLINYLEHMPLPDGMILLKSDINRIINNINKRKRIASIHQGLNESQIYQYTLSTQNLMENAASYLKSKGVKVEEYTINYANKNTASDIIKIIERI